MRAEAVCPYCEETLDTFPKRKRKCPHCSQPIYVRTLPDETEKILVTEARAKEINDLWNMRHWQQRWMDSLGSCGITEADYEHTKKQQTATRGFEPSASDTVWSLLNKAYNDNSRNKDFRTLSRISFMMALFLEEEGRDYKPSLVDSCRMRLLDYKYGEGKSEVKILTAGVGNACEACLKQEGQVFSIDRALELMPIPCADCDTRGGWCRCRYVAHFEL